MAEDARSDRSMLLLLLSHGVLSLLSTLGFLLAVVALGYCLLDGLKNAPF